VTYEPQVNSDVFAMFQSEVEGRIIDWTLLTKDVPAEYHHNLDYIIGMLDWDANVNPEFAATNRTFPRPVRPIAETEPDGYREQWVCYGTPYYSAKELTVLPKRAVTIRDAAAYGLILTQGYGRFGGHDVSTPSMIRFGQMTEDELFVTNEAANAGVRVENKSDTDQLVILKHFGPGNPEAEGRRPSVDEISHVSPSQRCGRARWYRTGSEPRSASTTCSISPRTPVDGVKFGRRPVSVRSAREHRLERRRGEASCRSNLRQASGRRLARGAGMAANRRRLRDGHFRRTAAVRDAGPEGLRNRQDAARGRDSPLGCDSHRFGCEPFGVGQGSAGQHEENRRHVPRGVHGGGSVRRAGCGRRRDLLGRACTAGNATSSCSKPWGPDTLGFQADMAHTLFTLGTTPGGSPAARRVRLEERGRSTPR
jgi:hypothetical protein